MTIYYICQLVVSPQYVQHKTVKDRDGLNIYSIYQSDFYMHIHKYLFELPHFKDYFAELASRSHWLQGHTKLTKIRLETEVKVTTRTKMKRRIIYWYKIK